MSAEQSDSKICFVIAPIGGPDSQIRSRSEKVRRHLIEPAVGYFGYTTQRADMSSNPTLITPEVVEHLVKDPLVIADLTDANPNVFYKLALRHVQTDKPVISIIQEDSRIPFDVKDFRAIAYDLTDPDKLEASRNELQ